MSGGVKTSVHYDRSQTTFTTSRVISAKEQSIIDKKKKVIHRKRRNLYKRHKSIIERGILYDNRRKLQYEGKWTIEMEKEYDNKIEESIMREVHNSDDEDDEDEDDEEDNSIDKKDVSTSMKQSSDEIETKLHYERDNDPGKHNLFVQLTGSRKFILFPPHVTNDMMPMDEIHLSHISQSMTFLHSIDGDMNEYDEDYYFSEYPSLKNVWKHRIEITLQGGDALLIPARWWHCTHVLTPSIALNWWFLNDCLKTNVEENEST